MSHGITLYRALLTLLAVVTLGACATFQELKSPQKGAKQSTKKHAPTVKVDKEPIRLSKNNAQAKSLPPRSDAERIENLGIDDVIRWEEPSSQSYHDNSRYDFPITVNSRVEGWIDYFTNRGRRHFERYLGRSSRYIPVMKHIFRKEGLPEDLVFLAMIESGFNLRARSWAKAVGPWQFIKGTGKRYGLQINNWIDERKDPIKSTVAAANYLKDLYLMFESWYLAAAAYNAGEYKILRAIRALNTNNYWRICKTRYIRRETKDYVPKLIAAAIIAKNPERYGFEEVAYQDPLDFEIVEIGFAVRLKDIAQLINADVQEVLDLNTELYRGIVPPGLNEPYQLRVPAGSQVLVERAIVTRRDQLAKSIRPVRYTIRRGDSLGRIARKFGIRLSDLVSVNNIRRTQRIYPGRSLMIPTYGTKSRRVASRKKYSRSKARKSSGRFIKHKVRKGDSLWQIAEKYDVTVKELFEWNRLRNSRIKPGKILNVKPKGKEAKTRLKKTLRSS